jgi:hypothetical protein
MHATATATATVLLLHIYNYIKKEKKNAGPLKAHNYFKPDEMIKTWIPMADINGYDRILS